MSFELDHIFILTSPGAPEADLLVQHGLVEGEPNRHPGQGTACRRFFFSDFMLELLWVCDEQEARAEPAARLCLADRAKWRGNGASPFGICLRPAGGTSTGEPPFPGWRYRPPYLPPHLSIHVSERSGRIEEPLLFYLPFARPQRGDSQPFGRQTPEAIRLHGPSLTEMALGELDLMPASRPLLELVFAAAGAPQDLRLNLPLIIRG